MTRKRAWLLAGAGGLAAAIAALVVAFDWDWLRGPLTRAAGDRLARSASVGHLAAEWKLRPRVTLQDVHVGNADWSARGEMFSAESVEVVLDLPELLRGRLVIPELRLVRPEITLERRADGSHNWSFGAAAVAEAAAPDDRHEMPLIGRIAFENGRIAYHDEIARLDLEGEIASAGGSGGEGEGEVRFGGHGSLNGEAFRLRLRGGSLLMLRETKAPYPLTIDVEAVASRGRIEGTLADPIKFEGLDLDLRLQGPDLAKLAPITGVPLPLTPPYDLKGRLQRNSGTWIIERMTGAMGHSDIGGQITIETDRPRLF
ncbi:MAG: AsmA family protein, partial [Ferrovibrionaceae bacterium]